MPVPIKHNLTNPTYVSILFGIYPVCLKNFQALMIRFEFRNIHPAYYAAFVIINRSYKFDIVAIIEWDLTIYLNSKPYPAIAVIIKSN